MEEIEEPGPVLRRSRFRSFLDTLNCMNTVEEEEDVTIREQRSSLDMQRRKSKTIDKQIKIDEKAFLRTFRLLLLGDGEAGKSTIVKQMKILHKNGYDTEERLQWAVDIRRNVIDNIVTIANAISDSPSSLQHEENKEKVQWLKEYAQLQYDSRKDIVYTEEFYDTVASLWKDLGAQKVYERIKEFEQSASAKYFLDRLDEIRKNNYLPTNLDILYCRVLTDNIIETKFQINKLSFHIFDVGGQEQERRKWIQCFYDVTAILFVCGCSSYNVVIEEKNKLEDSFKLFRQIWYNRWLLTRSCIMFLNKTDLLVEKIKNGNSKFEEYFPDVLNIPKNMKYPANIANFKEPYEVLRAMYYIQYTFMNITRSKDAEQSVNAKPTKIKRILYPHFTCAVNTENIKTVFNDCKDIIQRLHLEALNML